MSATTEQAKWALQLLMRRLPPGSRRADCVGIESDELDFDLILHQLSRDTYSGSEHERRFAAEGLAWLRDRHAVGPLLRALHDESRAVRYTAAVGLLAFCPLPDWTLDRLVEAGQDPDAGVREATLIALGRARTRVALAPLLAALGDDEPFVRRAAATGLERLGLDGITDPAAEQKLVELLWCDEDPRVVSAVYRAIGAQVDDAERIRGQYRWSEREQRLRQELLRGWDL